MNILPTPKGMPTILLARAGKYDPEGTLAAAEEAGAWAAWKKAATTLSPPAVTRLIGDAGLRGRGGAGYPTAEKWRAAAQSRRPISATSSPTATRPTRARRSTGR